MIDGRPGGRGISQPSLPSRIARQGRGQDYMSAAVSLVRMAPSRRWIQEA